jgi:hypothetical protein
MKIYRLNPEPELQGSFNNGILKLNNQDPIKATEEEILKRFNRGYWRCSK